MLNSPAAARSRVRNSVAVSVLIWGQLPSTIATGLSMAPGGVDSSPTWASTVASFDDSGTVGTDVSREACSGMKLTRDT